MSREIDGSETWRGFHARRARLKPPLRPDAEIAGRTAAAIADAQGPVLLLGVTPELADLADETIAIDWNPDMIAHVWPGDTDRRRAMVGNWLTPLLATGSCGAAIGDGSLNCLAWPRDYRRLFAVLGDVLRPGSPVAIRCYTTPDDGESADAVGAAALAGEVRGFHALKWRLATALTHERGDPNLPVIDILTAFDRLFPDRAALAAATGWALDEIAEIDAYRTGGAVYSFPRRDQVAATVGPAFGPAQFTDSGTYELAERCPLVRLRRV